MLGKHRKPVTNQFPRDKPTINLKLTILTFAGAGLQPVPFALKFHFVLFIWETLETGCKPVSAEAKLRL
ncbi:hypothetical protein KAK05_02870 [Candidatus Parcubacteria bacterium]|nr:hypothetical protein [Candidatus Parcubacteria bacterium]